MCPGWRGQVSSRLFHKVGLNIEIVRITLNLVACSRLPWKFWLAYFIKRRGGGLWRRVLWRARSAKTNSIQFECLIFPLLHKFMVLSIGFQFIMFPYLTQILSTVWRCPFLRSFVMDYSWGVVGSNGGLGSDLLPQCSLSFQSQKQRTRHLVVREEKVGGEMELTSGTLIDLGIHPHAYFHYSLPLLSSLYLLQLGFPRWSEYLNSWLFPLMLKLVKHYLWTCMGIPWGRWVPRSAFKGVHRYKWVSGCLS